MSNDALNMDINQQLVLVTGGARGLGEEITKSVLAHGGVSSSTTTGVGNAPKPSPTPTQARHGPSRRT